MALLRLRPVPWQCLMRCGKYHNYHIYDTPRCFGAAYFSIVRNSQKNELPSVEHFLRRRIETLGPISVADYMRTCLTSCLEGYYAKKDRIFGKGGDFITAPEISQVFGELIGLWFVHKWQAEITQNGHHPNRKIQLVELGPGTGTLLTDVLSALKKFDDIYPLLSLHLVEQSPTLCRVQRERIIGLQDQGTANQEQPQPRPGGAYHSEISKDGLPVSWYSSLNDFDDELGGAHENSGEIWLVANEFLDALPVYLFEYTKYGWRELMIGLDRNDSFTYVRAPAISLAARAFIPDDIGPVPLGTLLETSPEANGVGRKASQLIGRHGGAGLFIDYGENDHVLRSTLRGFREHRLVENILTNPGQMDITADVDFKELSRCCAPHCHVAGPVSQSAFLQTMGVTLRVQQLLRKATPQNGKQLISGLEQLIGPEHMGERFKFLGLTPFGSPNPIGFESDQ